MPRPKHPAPSNRPACYISTAPAVPIALMHCAECQSRQSRQSSRSSPCQLPGRVIHELELCRLVAQRLDRGLIASMSGESPSSNSRHSGFIGPCKPQIVPNASYRRLVPQLVRVTLRQLDSTQTECPDPAPPSDTPNLPATTPTEPSPHPADQTTEAASSLPFKPGTLGRGNGSVLQLIHDPPMLPIK